MERARYNAISFLQHLGAAVVMLLFVEAFAAVLQFIGSHLYILPNFVLKQWIVLTKRYLMWFGAQWIIWEEVSLLQRI